MVVMVTTALGNEGEGACLAVPKPLRAELIGAIPQSGVMVRAVKIQHHPLTFWEMEAVPFKFVPYTGRDERKKRIKTANLLHETFELRVPSR